MKPLTDGGAWAAGRPFPELYGRIRQECLKGRWRHSPRVLFEMWFEAGGEWSREDTPEQRLIGRSRNTYLLLEEKQTAKNISHILNGRVLFTPEVGLALATAMFTYWHYDEASASPEKRERIRGCSDPATCASEIINVIFESAKADQKKGFHVSRLPIQEGAWDDFAESLASFGCIYVLSRYRSIRGNGRDSALAEVAKGAHGKEERTALELFAAEEGSLSVLLQKTRERRTTCVWVCDYGLQHNEDASDWLAHWNFADLRTAFAAFLQKHARDFAEMVSDAHARCRFLVKNSPTLATKRDKLFRDEGPYVQAISANARVLKIDPLPEAMPVEWTTLLTGPRGQAQKQFPQTLLAGVNEDFHYFYFPSEQDAISTFETVEIEARYQPIDLTSSLEVVSAALRCGRNNELSSEAEKQLHFLNWDILDLKELMSF